MFNRIKYFIKKELLQTLREPRMRFMILVMPILQLLIFGYATVIEVTNIPTAVYDLAKSPQSREIISKFSASNYFKIKYYINSFDEMNKLINHEKVIAIIKINPDFSKKIKIKKTAALQIIIDGTNSVTAAMVGNYAGRILNQISREIIFKEFGKSTLINLEERALFNPQLESRFFYIPALIGLLVMMLGLSLTAMSIVHEKERGTLEQIIVSPIKPYEFILGKTLPFVGIIFVCTALQVIISELWFKIPFRGNLILFLLAIFLFSLSSLGIGIFISTISKTQQEAIVTSFFFNLPSILLSGFIFPISNMPKVIQYLTYIIPLRYFLIISRNSFLKGGSWGILWKELLALAIIGILILTFSTLKFKKRLE